jgi:hypothetical protein
MLNCFLSLFVSVEVCNAYANVFSEMLESIYQCKWYYVPENRDIRTHHLEFTRSLVDTVPQLWCECIKVTFVTRNMIYHEFFQKDLSLAPAGIFETSWADLNVRFELLT